MNADISEAVVDTEQTATKAGDKETSPNKGDTERETICDNCGKIELKTCEPQELKNVLMTQQHT